jgi:hypothetical protein
MAGMKGAGQIDGDDGVPTLDRKVFYLGDVLDASVVHQNVDAAKGVGRKLHHGFNFGGFAHVCPVVCDFDAQGSDFGLRALRIAKAVQHDVRALFGQSLGNAQTDTAG